MIVVGRRAADRGRHVNIAVIVGKRVRVCIDSHELWILAGIVGGFGRYKSPVVDYVIVFVAQCFVPETRSL